MCPTAVAYVRYFHREAESSTPRARLVHPLPFTRLSAVPVEYDFVELGSIIEPAHVVPNFDTRREGWNVDDGYDRFMRSYDRFWLWKDHFPTNL